MARDEIWDFDTCDVNLCQGTSIRGDMVYLEMAAGGAYGGDYFPAELSKKDVATLVAHLQHVLATWPDANGEPPAKP